MKDGKGMAAPIAVGGHYDPTSAPKMKKGEFAAVGTFIDEGDMVSIEPTEREGLLEFIFALDVPTEWPRLGLTFEASIKPFLSTDVNPFTGRSAEDLGSARDPLSAARVQTALSPNVNGEREDVPGEGNHRALS